MQLLPRRPRVRRWDIAGTTSDRSGMPETSSPKRRPSPDRRRAPSSGCFPARSTRSLAAVDGLPCALGLAHSLDTPLPGALSQSLRARGRAEQLSFAREDPRASSLEPVRDARSAIGPVQQCWPGSAFSPADGTGTPRAQPGESGVGSPHVQLVIAELPERVRYDCCKKAHHTS